MSASEEMRPDIPADAGFTLTEVLVALVVVGFIAAATGALASFAVATRDRAREVEAKIASFRDLQGFADIIAARSARSRATVSLAPAVGFTLVDEESPSRHASISLQDKNGTLELSVEFGATYRVTVPIGPFQSATMEYLAKGTRQLGWLSAPEMQGREPIAVRLKLTERGRQWSVLLWVDSGHG